MNVCADKIPSELKALPQWVVWRREERDGKPTKVPYNAITGNRASVTNPADWGTFDQATDTFSAGGFDGVGFVLTKDDEAILAIMKKHNPVEASDVARGKETLRLARPYFAPPSGVPHGVPIIAQWETSIRAMETIGLIQKPGLPVARYVTDEFALAAS